MIGSFQFFKNGNYNFNMLNIFYEFIFKMLFIVIKFYFINDLCLINFVYIGVY